MSFLSVFRPLPGGIIHILYNHPFKVNNSVAFSIFIEFLHLSTSQLLCHPKKKPCSHLPSPPRFQELCSHWQGPGAPVLPAGELPVGLARRGAYCVQGTILGSYDKQDLQTVLSRSIKSSVREMDGTHSKRTSVSFTDERCENRAGMWPSGHCGPGV